LVVEREREREKSTEAVIHAQRARRAEVFAADDNMVEELGIG